MENSTELYQEAYARLNPAQKEAVDTLDGPVMVIAGPGTGKTQVLALRIATILKNTDTEANSILCLTFTRSGVEAMRNRLMEIIGSDARKVVINTFHSFAIELIEKYYGLLDFTSPPMLLDETQAVLLIDELLHSYSWEHLRPRSNPGSYFSDLKSLISLLKRERITAEDFLVEIEHDITALKADPESISTRGESKGKLKKEIENKIEGLEKTKEIVLFFQKYEALKKEKNFMDYDDVLEYAVVLALESEDVQADIRENYLYVLVDEHQDSSGVQNNFLKAIWQDTERPNIFVVGDDRQLIYGFGGASMEYFNDFKMAFGKAHLITLVENYRSTKPILHVADELLKSSLSTGALRSNKKELHPVELSEYSYGRDEIIAAGLFFKARIESGIAPESCALLVPKNRHVNTAMGILTDMGLSVRTSAHTSFFKQYETAVFRRVLRIVHNPFSVVHLAESLFDTVTGITPLEAHAFFQAVSPKKITLADLVSYTKDSTLFNQDNHIKIWGETLTKLIERESSHNLIDLVHHVGNTVLIETSTGNDTLLERIEVVRTMIHLVTNFVESHPQPSHALLGDFLDYLDRLEAYNHTIPLATLESGKGITVQTLHASKGLEYDAVWIAHMNESILMSGKRMPFTLPQSIKAKMEAKDLSVAKREVYVAITRAKLWCTLSYAHFSTTGGTLTLAEVLADVSVRTVNKTFEETEQELIAYGPKVYVEKIAPVAVDDQLKLIDLISRTYTKRNVSVTLLNNFFECPWKWYFRNLLQLPDQKTESLIFGSAIHASIEAILKHKGKVEGKIDTVFLTTTLTNALIHEGITEGVVMKTMLKEGMQVLTDWIDTYYPNLARDRTTERSLSVHDTRFSHLTLYGKIDLTERFSDGSIVVTDFKTGGSKTSGVIEKPDEEGRLSSFMRQLAMYTLLIRATDRETNIASQLLFLEASKTDKNALYKASISDEEIDMLVSDIMFYDEALKTGTWMDRPCYYKAWGSVEACPHCTLATHIGLKK